jgi:hypothetical protein
MRSAYILRDTVSESFIIDYHNKWFDLHPLMPIIKSDIDS